jgi:hypothetical protein
VARPRKYTPDVLQAKVNGYFEYCKDNNRKANQQGLSVYLDICLDTINEWVRNEDNKYPEFSETIKKAFSRMSDEFQQRTDAMAIISLKQPCYGGFVDRPDTSAKDVNITVKIANGDEKLVD